MMDAKTRRRVRERAKDRCEYCLLPQAAAPFLTFHIEHVHAVQHGRDDSLDNLCLACPHCNLHKGPNLTTLSEDTGEIIRLFHPRNDAWADHFRLAGAQIVGLSEEGIATVRLLKMNTPDQIRIRAALMQRGEF
ncbi:HNH endonuclease [Maioricimonas rarisocia]|uniref:HNH endonuclease n=1 Tax=Maioricimonas rarisocia TaxID=2528026 RepID=A0A517Z105_9PLAN|nr:HNH endonuclease [Maioricimonas rarisocia]